MNLHIEVIQEQRSWPIVVTSIIQGNYIHLYLNNKMIQLRTPEAYKIGIALALTQSKLEPGEMVAMSVNHVTIPLMYSEAQSVIKHLLLKAERVDTQQRGLKYGRR